MTVTGWLILIASITLSGAAVAHALLQKPDPKAAMGWIAVCVLTPLVGPVLYFLFGINRVVTRAQRLASDSPFQVDALADNNALADPNSAPHSPPRLAMIAAKVTGWPLLSGNQVKPLYNGEQAYPMMLEAIANATDSVFMTTYIFTTRSVGGQFIEALTAASERGVDVRVIIDGLGELTNLPRASTHLLRKGVRVERFIPPKLLPPAIYINLRNHRKILVVDNHLAFTGGMNISDNHLAANVKNRHRVTDVHFRLSGPVVTQIRHAFLEDWGFAADERTGPDTASYPPPNGSALCRVIVDGPNEYLGQLAAVILAVICAAKERVAIMTPYFLPSQDLLMVLRAAILRGVEVTVILPGKSDHRFVQWATRRVLEPLTRDGVAVYYQPAPFCHSKLLLIDHDYCLIGSANIDPRSLRLNFELGVEVFDPTVTNELWEHFRCTQQRSKLVTAEVLESRSAAIKLRDAAAWICSPYL